MAIRIRKVNGITIALCAARSVEKEGDLYLDDTLHHALATKFSYDFNLEGFMSGPFFNQDEIKLIEQEESNNPNRDWWNNMYGNIKL